MQCPVKAGKSGKCLSSAPSSIPLKAPHPVGTPASASTLREAPLNCPFCDEEIKDRATVCKHCGRDLLILRPVLDRFADIETRLVAVETALHTLSGHVDTVRTNSLPPAAGSGFGDFAAVRRMVGHFVALVALLLIAHWVIIGILDLNTLVLRLVSILIPLPFGLTGPRSLRATIGMAATASVAAVWGMLVITGAIDHVPVLPQGTRDWIETLEYVASIGLAYGSGRLVAEWWAARKSPAKAGHSLVYEMATLLARSSAPRNETKVHAKQRVEAIANWLNIMALMVTAACSIATGVGRFFH
ncbi:hypothetical protein CWS72_04630 [Telmatospirillum siberiense]|uniref:Zinc ribbon domain-containing protein n=1 Tax=Telmatospirillum siberiense TaxID=382514 RepID=A0A2N3PZK9_9PROT|nr:hypothetical protein CWS72_04630 [Telmatospirillum siberiense]